MALVLIGRVLVGSGFGKSDLRVMEWSPAHDALSKVAVAGK